MRAGATLKEWGKYLVGSVAIFGALLLALFLLRALGVNISTGRTPDEDEAYWDETVPP
jgi:hypothetical protein